MFFVVFFLSARHSGFTEWLRQETETISASLISQRIQRGVCGRAGGSLQSQALSCRRAGSSICFQRTVCPTWPQHLGLLYCKGNPQNINRESLENQLISSVQVSSFQCSRLSLLSRQHTQNVMLLGFFFLFTFVSCSLRCLHQKTGLTMTQKTVRTVRMKKMTKMNTKTRLNPTRRKKSTRITTRTGNRKIFDAVGAGRGVISPVTHRLSLLKSPRECSHNRCLLLFSYLITASRNK